MSDGILSTVSAMPCFETCAEVVFQVLQMPLMTFANVFQTVCVMVAGYLCLKACGLCHTWCLGSCYIILAAFVLM